MKKLLNVLCKVAVVCENPGSEKLAHDISEASGSEVLTFCSVVHVRC